MENDEIKPTTLAFIGNDQDDKPSVCLAFKQSSVVEMDGELVAGMAFSKKHAVELAEILTQLSREID